MRQNAYPFKKYSEWVLKNQDFLPPDFLPHFIYQFNLYKVEVF